MQPVLRLFHYILAGQVAHTGKGCISVLLPASSHVRLRARKADMGKISGRGEERKKEREMCLGGLELDFSAREREAAAFMKAAEPRHRNFRRRALAETADNGGLGPLNLVLSRFISSSVLPSCLYARDSPFRYAPTRRDTIPTLLPTPPTT